MLSWVCVLDLVFWCGCKVWLLIVMVCWFAWIAGGLGEFVVCGLLCESFCD